MTREGFSKADMLKLAACLETCSNHPLAAVIVGHSAANQLPLDAEVSNSQVLPGEISSCFSADKEQLADGCDVGDGSYLLSNVCFSWSALGWHCMQDWDLQVWWQAFR